MIIPRLYCRLRRFAIKVKRLPLIVVIRQPGAENNPTNQECRRELLPTRLSKKLAPAVEAVKHHDRKSHDQSMRLRRPERKCEAQIKQTNSRQRQILDGLPVARRMILPEPQNQ